MSSYAILAAWLLFVALNELVKIAAIEVGLLKITYLYFEPFAACTAVPGPFFEHSSTKRIRVADMGLLIERITVLSGFAQKRGFVMV